MCWDPGRSDPSCPREKALCWAETGRAALPTGREAQRRLWAHLGSLLEWRTVLRTVGAHDHTSGKWQPAMLDTMVPHKADKDQESRIFYFKKFLRAYLRRTLGEESLEGYA